VSLRVRAGELVGVAGVDGNGQRELALAIAGLAPHGGSVRIGARDVTGASTRARLAAGLAHIPEDRHHGGLVVDASVADNIALARPDITGRFRIDRKRVAAFADAQIRALDIRPADREAIVRMLSGGNQQKVVIARELSRPALTAIVAAQPTRGVDLGAVARIHDQLRAAAAAGAGVLVISADLDELLALCHRVVVLLRGRLVGERAGAALQAPDARATLGAMMTGAEAAA
jgi:simple sugar transport system ATP-binding protein